MARNFSLKWVQSNLSCGNCFLEESFYMYYINDCNHFYLNILLFFPNEVK